jgi:hypothetical protein
MRVSHFLMQCANARYVQFEDQVMAESRNPFLSSSAALPPIAQQTVEYWVDAWQRTVLFWDVLRQRSDQYYAQKAKAVPNVLSFEAELLMDGRTLARPVNYGLVRIKPPEGVIIDPRKRPFVVVDPRAGHGPGIGGFKADSELGVALRAGHPCYFVGFTPEPIPGQTIEDIMQAEAQFWEKMAADTMAALGKEAFGKAAFYAAESLGFLVMGNLPQAGTAAAASAAYGVAGAALTYGAAEMGAFAQDTKGSGGGGGGGGGSPSRPRLAGDSGGASGSNTQTIVNHYYAPTFGGRQGSDAEAGVRMGRYTGAADRRVQRDRT